MVTRLYVTSWWVASMTREFWVVCCKRGTNWPSQSQGDYNCLRICREGCQGSPSISPPVEVHAIQPTPPSYHWCGGKHLPSACQFRGVKCFKCKEDPVYTCVISQTDAVREFQHRWEGLANGKRYRASLSIISESMFIWLWPADKAPILQHLWARLRTYMGEEIKVKGEIQVKVCHNGQVEELLLLVVYGSGPSLLGGGGGRLVKPTKARLAEWQSLHNMHRATWSPTQNNEDERPGAELCVVSWNRCWARTEGKG